MARFWDVIDFKIWFETYLDMAGFWDVIDFRIWFGTCLDTARFWDVIDFRIWFGTYLDMAGFCNVADLRTLFGDLDTKTKWVAKPRGVCFFFFSLSFLCSFPFAVVVMGLLLLHRCTMDNRNATHMRLNTTLRHVKKLVTAMDVKL
jgi:hypothetical protein